MVLGQYRAVLVGIWSEKGDTCWYLVVPGQYRAILGGTRFNFGEFDCCDICLFLLGALSFFLFFLSYEASEL